MSMSLIQDDLKNNKKGEIVLTEKLSDDLCNLLLNSSYSDVVFLVEDEKIPCHRVILAARSEYFRALLYGSLKEAGQSEVTLKVPKEAFKIILKYIYTGKINLRLCGQNLILVLDTLGLANLFGYVELKGEIASFLKSSILSVATVCNILDASRLYELNDLTNICYNFIDKNAAVLLNHETFKFDLSKDSLVNLLSRDSFYAPELEIFKAIQEWIGERKNQLGELEIAEIVSHVRLPLISLEDLLSVVRPSGILEANYLLDAIQIKTQSRLNRLPYRGRLFLDENIATSKLGARVIQGICDGMSLLEPSDHAYDMEKGYTRHEIVDQNDAGIIIELGDVFLLNYIKMKLWDLDNRSYSYVINVSVDKEHWEEVTDYSNYLCRSMQHLYFEKRPVKFIRVTGTKNTVNRIFHLIALEAMFTQNTPKLIDGLVAPKLNVATIEKSAAVLEGVSRNKNSLLNGNVKDYDWDCGYTCHQLGSGNILIQLGQPYLIDSIKILLWDCDERTYSFYIEASVNETDWTTIVDKKTERLQSWQTFSFELQPISFFRIVGTFNSANEIFHVVHFECPSQE